MKETIRHGGCTSDGVKVPVNCAMNFLYIQRGKMDVEDLRDKL
jgi:hypothetical protein